MPIADRMLRVMVHAVSRCLYRLATIGLAKGPHVSRYTMYARLAAHRRERKPGERALAVSGSEDLVRLLGFGPEQITDASYPECNILGLPFEDDRFDAVVSDQVVEHVEGDPFAAVAESFRVVKPGGLVVHTSCFMTPVHGSPGDFWRFTPEGLALLVKPFGDIIEADAWGNPLVLLYGFLGLRREPVPHAAWHPAHRIAAWNVRSWPMSTWVVARKHDPLGQATASNA